MKHDQLIERRPIIIQTYYCKTDSESCLTIDLFYAYLCLNHANMDMIRAWNQDNSSLRQSRNVLAGYFAIKDNTWLQDDSVELVLGYLKAWDSFKGDIARIVTHQNPSTSKHAQKLLGFSSDSSESTIPAFTVSESSLIYHRANKSNEDDELSISANEINSIIREELSKRLHSLLDSMHTAALASPWAMPRRYSASPHAITLTRSGVYNELLQPSGILHVSTVLDSTTSLSSNVIRPLRAFLFGRDKGRLNQAVQLLEYILDQPHRVDATALVYLVEVLTRELIAHMNASESADLDAIFMPFSWVMTLAFKYDHTQSFASTECLGTFLHTIQMISLDLRFGIPGRWYINGRQGSPAAMDLLNLRLCWCVALMIANMPEFGEYMSLGVETIKRLADDDMPLKYRHRHTTSAGLYHEFSDVTKQSSCLGALRRTLRHESLLLVLDDSSQSHAAKGVDGIVQVICETSSSLVEKLKRLLRGESLISRTLPPHSDILLSICKIPQG
ncbi:hypothetical protein RSAG8_08112, partial [Rhizoctonia solani AG-8 WAC10335]